MARLTHCMNPECTATTYSPIANRWVPVFKADRAGLSWLDPHCANEELGYYAENDYRPCKPTDGYTYGVEFEVNNPTAELRAVFTNQRKGYRWLPTHDCTVDLEFKSPLFDGLKWQKVLDSAERALSHGTAYVGDNCGTHLHVGNVHWCDDSAMDIVRMYYRELYQPLWLHMMRHEYETINLFGRFFNGYCDFNGNHRDRYQFVNVTNDHFEYRLPRFRSAAQYKAVYRVCKEWTALVGTHIVGNYYKTPKTKTHSEWMQGKCKIASERMIAAFNKHAATVL